MKDAQLEELEALEALERDSNGLTKGQYDRIEYEVRSIQANGWPQILDGISEETGLSRIEILLLWIYFVRGGMAQAQKIALAKADEVRDKGVSYMEKWAPIMDRIKEEMDEDEDWKP